jgi:hypothetical protein
MHKLITMVLVAASVATMASAAPRLVPLTLEESARYGATHCITVNAADMVAVTATNTAWTNTVAVTAPCSVKFVAYLLNQPFNDPQDVTTNYTKTTTNSIAVSCGDTNNTTRWISALQVAYDQTPTVTASYGTDYTVAVGATNAAATVTSPIMNAQTSDVQLVVTFGAPGAGASLGNLTRGQARFFFKIIGTGWQAR